jgi:hypothetical protein
VASVSAIPPARPAQQREEDHERAGDVDEHLDHVGPDDRGRSATDRVDDHRGAEDADRPRHRHAGDDRDDQGRREQADAVGERPRDQEEPRRHGADRRPETLLEQLVRRHQRPAEIPRQEHDADDDPADHVPGRELQERPVAGVGRRRHADERQRARFGRDDREADRPPGDRVVGQEVVLGVLLKLGEMRSENGDGDEVGGDDGVVDRIHARGIIPLIRLRPTGFGRDACAVYDFGVIDPYYKKMMWWLAAAFVASVLAALVIVEVVMRRYAE